MLLTDTKCFSNEYEAECFRCSVSRLQYGYFYLTILSFIYEVLQLRYFYKKTKFKGKPKKEKTKTCATFE